MLALQRRMIETGMPPDAGRRLFRAVAHRWMQQAIPSALNVSDPRWVA